MDFDSSGKFLYSANLGSCSPHETAGAASAFSIATSGALTEISSIKVPFGPTRIQLDPTKRFGYISTFSNEIEIVSVSATGQISLAGTIRTRAGASIVLRLGAKPVSYTPRSLYAANSPSNSMFSINASSGALTSTRTVAAGTVPRAITVTPSQKFGYVANQGSNDVPMYTIDSGTGALTAIGKVSAGTAPGSIAMDPSGRFAYVANSGSNDVSMFTIDSLTGQLTANSTIAAGKTPYSLSVDPTGRYLLVVNQSSMDISLFDIDATSGALMNAGPFP